MATKERRLGHVGLQRDRAEVRANDFPRAHDRVERADYEEVIVEQGRKPAFLEKPPERSDRRLVGAPIAHERTVKLLPASAQGDQTLGRRKLAVARTEHAVDKARFVIRDRTNATGLTEGVEAPLRVGETTRAKTLDQRRHSPSVARNRARGTKRS